METEIWPELIEHFALLPTPRNGLATRHKFVDILFIAICAAIYGADDWVGVATYGQGKLHWLQHFLELPSSIPSHDTFGRVFAQLAAERFAACFAAWSMTSRSASAETPLPSIAERCAVAMIAVRARRRYTWSAPGPPEAICCWGRCRWTANRTRSRRFSRGHAVTVRTLGKPPRPLPVVGQNVSDTQM